MKINDIDLKDFDYVLPHDRIARFPAKERDLSKLLVFRDNKISCDIFRHIDNFLPEGSLLVFNNTRVIRARLLFMKETGAVIEVLCIAPLRPSGYELSFGSVEPVEWKCIIGNLKKWKTGTIKISYLFKGISYDLEARKISQEGDAWRIRFEWGSAGTSFGEVIELAGQLPLPPYLERDAVEDDLDRYQTVYSRINGSVAAPTAGLHFTGEIMERLKTSGISSAEITLHVGTGTFRPIKSINIIDHEMHCEHFLVTRDTIEMLLDYHGKIIPVGTTSVRTLESLYWLGIRLRQNPQAVNGEFSLGQWDPYGSETVISDVEALHTILKVMRSDNISVLGASTSIMIVPGYRFRMIGSMITNFHQPMSTLLLLVSALTGEKWKDIYKYALDNNFRFLSYGDCSFIQPRLDRSGPESGIC